MSYLQDRIKDRRKKRNLFYFGLAVFLVLLSLLGVFKGLGSFLQKVARPLWKSSDVVYFTIEGQSYVLRTKKSVFLENEKLIKQNEQLQSDMLDYLILKKENEELKEIFGRVSAKQNFVLATILTKPNRSLYDTVVVDIGEDQNLKEGDMVFADAEIPIGRITKVYSNTSLVTLYSSAGESIEAQIDGFNTSVALIGRGGGNFEMTVPQDLIIPSGTFVTVPSIHSRILAIVVNVVSDAHDPMQKIILKSPVNIQELKWVQVLK